jgi:hypothetical protein
MEYSKYKHGLSMSDQDPQKDSNVTDFPNADTAKNPDQAPSQQTSQIGAGAAERKAFEDSEQREAEMEKYRLRAEIEANIREKTNRKRSEDFRRTVFTLTVIFTVFMLLMFVSMTNPSIYKIDLDTLLIVNQALNAIILLTIPFLLGIVGASARILIATVKPELKGNLLISSGLMATFSWVGIKSGVLIAIIAPHLERASVTSEQTISSAHDFYTMAFVAILVGMFSTNLFLIISEKVEQITQQVHNQKTAEKKSKKSRPTTSV